MKLKVNNKELNSHVKESSRKLGLLKCPVLLKSPENYIYSSCCIIAIWISNKALNSLTNEELFAIIDHELGHIKQIKKYIVLYVYLFLPFVAVILFSIKQFFFGSFSFGFILYHRLFKARYMVELKHSAEFDADRISAELGNIKGLKSVFEKMKRENKESKSKIRKLEYLRNKFFFSNYDTYSSDEERIKRLEETSHSQA